MQALLEQKRQEWQNMFSAEHNFEQEWDDLIIQLLETHLALPLAAQREYTWVGRAIDSHFQDLVEMSEEEREDWVPIERVTQRETRSQQIQQGKVLFVEFVTLESFFTINDRSRAKMVDTL